MIEPMNMVAALGFDFRGCTFKICDRMWHTFCVMGHVDHMRSQAGGTTATFVFHDLPHQFEIALVGTLIIRSNSNALRLVR